MTLDVAIDADPEWDSSTDWPGLARAAAGSAVARSAFPQLARGTRPVEISVRLTSDSEVRSLNAQWRSKDMATNVLSFPLVDRDELEECGDQPGDGPELMLGDIVLAHGVCAREAREKGTSLERHAAHLLVHGTLHLLGYDHQGDCQAADMEALERLALADLGIPDPYAGER